MATSRRRLLASAGALVAGVVAPHVTAAPARAPGRAPAKAPAMRAVSAVAARQASTPVSGALEGALEAAFAATWEEDGRYFVGVLGAAHGEVTALRRQPVPTRAHGIAVEPQGTILLASRRPGDWLLRFDPRRGTVTDWDWSDGAFVYNGHVIASADGRRLFTTETSLETGQGSIGVRDARTLALLARWPTRGIDPHEVVLGRDGGLWVANGGIETRPATGRTKHHLERMDSSLVRLDAVDGRVIGQWRLEDRRLGLRHLASVADGTIAIALQAEHDDEAVRRLAPVLALWDRRRGLRPVALPEGIDLSGYGGSVAAQGGGIAVSCPRAGKVVRWDLAEGEPRWRAPVLLDEACPIAAGWLGGAGAVVHADADGSGAIEQLPLDESIRLDNHWALMDRARVPAPAAGSSRGSRDALNAVSSPESA